MAKDLLGCGQVLRLASRVPSSKDRRDWEGGGGEAGELREIKGSCERQGDRLERKQKQRVAACLRVLGYYC